MTITKADRELLELAAEAAGMEHQWEQPRGAKTGWLRARPAGEQTAFPVWNPLDNDGEALRLAAELGRQRTLVLTIGCGGADVEFHHPRTVAFESHVGNDQAALRRAIVTAAADIGRTMAKT